MSCPIPTVVRPNGPARGRVIERKKLYLKAMAVRRKIKKTNYWTSSWKQAFVISQVFFKSSVYHPPRSRQQKLDPFISVYLVSGKGVLSGRN